MATPASIIAEIDTQIATIVANPTSIASYKIGDKQVSRVDILRELRATREYYQQKLEEDPYEKVQEFAFDFTDLGEDDSEYIGDD